MNTVIEAECLAEDYTYEKVLPRAEFELLCDPVFQRCISPLTTALADANLTKAQVDEVVLVGGSTRIPKIRQMLTDYFDGK